MKQYKYVNAPRYLLRRNCIRRLMKDIPRGHALEIGCGGGDLCETVYKSGFSILGIDYSKPAIEMCRQRLSNLLKDPRISFEEMDVSEINKTYNLVLMMEVLEHIEDDVAAISKVAELVKTGGHLLLSVPANQKWFGPFDHFTGHFRRYERNQLANLMEAAGFEVQTMWAYGVPLANLTEIVRNLIYRNHAVLDKKEATKKSGINREIENRFRFFSNDFFLFPFYLMQRLFFQTNLGTGLLVKAVKR